jgi:hypothetical protein
MRLDYLGLVGCTGAMALFIIMYSKYRCQHPEFKDFLGGYPLGRWPGPLLQMADGWSISHFGFFALLGLAFPKTWILALSLGAVWEGLEFATQYSTISILDKMRGLAVCKNNHDTAGQSFFWYAKWTDLIMNGGGLALGKLVSVLLTS